MCLGGMYPNNSGIDISALEVGDEIIIREAGQEELTTYIWKKDGYSALTASGHILSCLSDLEFEVTGNHTDDFEVSDKARNILLQIDAMIHSYDVWDVDDDPLELL